METPTGGRTVTCDIIFIGASIPNLLAASALLERIDSITIRILDLPSHRPVAAQPFLTVISPEAWRALKELNGRFANLVQRRKLFLNRMAASLEEKGRLEESSRWLMSDRFYDLLRLSLPENVVCRVDAVKQIEELADRVLIQLNDGCWYESKLLISDAESVMSVTSPSSFVEVNITAAKRTSLTQSQWKTSTMYLSRSSTDSDIDVFSCLVPSDIMTDDSVHDALCKVPLLRNVLSGMEWTSVVHRLLLSSCISSARGRTARSGEMSSSLPFASPLKAEYEFEEVLHLKRAILNKGLTAAAISDWKRRQTASSTTQYLGLKKSPLDLMPASENVTHDLQRAHCSSNVEHPASAPVESSALGKPLVWKDLKPYAPLTLI